MPLSLMQVSRMRLQSSPMPFSTVNHALPASQKLLQLQGGRLPTCAASTDACICSSIHRIGQHLLHEECIIGDDGCCQVGVHLLCDLQNCVHLAVIVLCENLQVKPHCISTALLAVDMLSLVHGDQM